VEKENRVLECKDIERIWQINEIRNTGRTWNKVKGIAGDRNVWKLFMDALCSTRGKRT
jgi:hypothetical protein